MSCSVPGRRPGSVSGTKPHCFNIHGIPESHDGLQLVCTRLRRRRRDRRRDTLLLRLTPPLMTRRGMSIYPTTCIWAVICCQLLTRSTHLQVHSPGRMPQAQASKTESTKLIHSSPSPLQVNCAPMTSSLSLRKRKLGLAVHAAQRTAATFPIGLESHNPHHRRARNRRTNTSAVRSPTRRLTWLRARSVVRTDSDPSLETISPPQSTLGASKQARSERRVLPCTDYGTPRSYWTPHRSL